MQNYNIRKKNFKASETWNATSNSCDETSKVCDKTLYIHIKPRSSKIISSIFKMKQVSFKAFWIFNINWPLPLCEGYYMLPIPSSPKMIFMTSVTLARRKIFSERGTGGGLPTRIPTGPWWYRVNTGFTLWELYTDHFFDCILKLFVMQRQKSAIKPFILTWSLEVLRLNRRIFTDETSQVSI